MPEFQTTVVTFTLTPEMAGDMARQIWQAQMETNSRAAGIKPRVVRHIITTMAGDVAPTPGRTLWIQFVVGCVLLIAAAISLALAAQSRTNTDQLGLIGVALGAAGVGFFWDWKQKRVALRGFLADPAVHGGHSFGEYGDVEFTLSLSGVRWKCRGKAWEWDWSCIFRVDDLPSYIMFRDCDGDAMGFPKTALHPRDPGEIVVTSRAELAAKGFDQVSRIRAFLAEHDLKCPTCTYNLRNAAGDRCPECGMVLTYDTLPAHGAPWMPST